MWYIIGFVDNIIKLFQYAWFIIIPVILLVVCLLIKRKKISKTNIKTFKNISSTISCLIMLIIVGLFTVRIWGPNFYKIIIGFSICNKEKIVENKLEAKYGKNFNYISQKKIATEKHSADTLGQDINDNYSVKYIFKDDDGVIAIVEYKKNYQSDYYESKRSKYEIEKAVNDYAKAVDFNKKFYVYVESPYEMISNSDLNDKARNDFILEERNNNRIIFVLTEQSYENQSFIISSLKKIFDKNNYVKIQEYVVGQTEYERAVNFYKLIDSQNGIAGHDYDEHFKFNKNDQIQYKYYYIR